MPIIPVDPPHIRWTWVWNDHAKLLHWQSYYFTGRTEAGGNGSNRRPKRKIRRGGRNRV
jgi:hypothetical protein